MQPTVRRSMLAFISAAMLAALLAALAAACTADPGGATRVPAHAATALGGRPSDLLIGTPRAATVAPTAAPVVGEAPDVIVAAVRADLAARIGRDAASVAAIVRSEAVTWPDGSMGCREVRMTYVTLQTPGYWIVLRVNGVDYDYRVAERGTPRRCERGLQAGPGGWPRPRPSLP